MQQMPNMAAMAGEQQQPQQQQQGMQITPEMVQQQQTVQKPDSQKRMIQSRIVAMLKEKGYYDLPENKGRENEILAEIQELVDAIFENNTEFVQTSDIYSFITSQKGQRDAMRPKEEQMEMPSMEGMV